VELNDRAAFCRWVNEAIAHGAEFAWVITHDINGTPYPRQWPLKSIKDTGTQYEVYLHGYGVGALPYGTRFYIVAP
jgi:hypothetical protein